MCFLLISFCFNISAVLSVTVVSDFWSIFPPHCSAPADDCGCRAAASSSAGDAPDTQQSEGLLLFVTLRKSLFYGCRDADCCKLTEVWEMRWTHLCGVSYLGKKRESYLSSLWFHTEHWRVPVSFCDSSVHVSCFSIRQRHDTEISSLINVTI